MPVEEEPPGRSCFPRAERDHLPVQHRHAPVSSKIMLPMRESPQHSPVDVGPGAVRPQPLERGLGDRLGRPSAANRGTRRNIELLLDAGRPRLASSRKSSPSACQSTWWTRAIWSIPLPTWSAVLGRDLGDQPSCVRGVVLGMPAVDLLHHEERRTEHRLVALGSRSPVAPRTSLWLRRASITRYCSSNTDRGRSCNRWLDRGHHPLSVRLFPARSTSRSTAASRSKNPVKRGGRLMSDSLTSTGVEPVASPGRERAGGDSRITLLRDRHGER